MSILDLLRIGVGMDEGWGRAIIQALLAQGVRHFCCAPGSRSTPLVAGLEQEPAESSLVHFDERGVAFHALGIAKGTRSPVAIVVTSGTAVANLLPAIMEAHEERIPLILLTADRPPELRFCGANQTIDQVKLFENFVRWQVDLPPFSSSFPARYLATTIGHAVAMAQFPTAGPVHVNCMFREPFFSSVQPQPSSFPHFSPSISFPSLKEVKNWEERLSMVDHGVILCGSDHIPYSKEVIALGKRLQWPILPDILSPLRTAGREELMISHFELILQTKQMECSGVIQFGNRFVSKTVFQWLEKQKLSFYLHVSDHLMRQDPFHLVTHHFHSDPRLFCQSFKISKSSTQRGKEWEDLNKRYEGELLSVFEGISHLTEPYIFTVIPRIFGESWAFFIGNSMPIRDANQYVTSQHKCGPFFGNRGVSGIDGNLSTAVGIARGLNRPTLAIIGDLTCLHDLNSLALVKRSPVPVVVVVINNQGGRIFSSLPIGKREDLLERFFTASHQVDFEKAAALFDLSYLCPTFPCDLFSSLEELASHPRSCLIEMKVPSRRDPGPLGLLPSSVDHFIQKVPEEGELFGELFEELL